MQKDILDIVSQSIDLYDDSKADEAFGVLYDLFKVIDYLPDDKKEYTREEYSLAMDTYVFFTDRDLIEEGKIEGFANSDEIRKEIVRLKKLRDSSQPAKLIKDLSP